MSGLWPARSTMAEGIVMKSVWRTSESDPIRTLRPAPAPKRPRQAKTSPRDEARQLLYAHEEERRRLSLALHDSMTQSLAALATNVDLIERSASVLSPRTRAIVAETRFIARQCFQQVRRLTDHLYPPLVAEVGLPLALRCTVASFAERTGVRIACQSEDCPRLPSSYIDRFHVDAAVFSGEALAFLVGAMGEDRVMLGSDYPYPLGEQQVGSLIRANASLSERAREKLLHANATRFFGLEAARADRAEAPPASCRA